MRSIRSVAAGPDADSRIPTNVSRIARTPTWDRKNDGLWKGTTSRWSETAASGVVGLSGDADDQGAALPPQLGDAERGLAFRRRRQADHGVPVVHVEDVVREAAVPRFGQAERRRHHAAEKVKVLQKRVRIAGTGDEDAVARMDVPDDRGNQVRVDVVEGGFHIPERGPAEPGPRAVGGEVGGNQGEPYDRRRGGRRRGRWPRWVGA